MWFNRLLMLLCAVSAAVMGLAYVTLDEDTDATPNGMGCRADAHCTEYTATGQHPLMTAIALHSTPDGLTRVLDARGTLYEAVVSNQWNEIANGVPIGAVAFTDDGLIGVAVSRTGRGARTSDGGRHWHVVILPLQEPLHSAIHVEDESFLALGNNVMIRSLDAGVSWDRLPVPPGHYVAMAHRSGRVIVVSRRGRIFISDDRGDRWRQPLVTRWNGFRDVAFADDSTLIVIGLRGLIVRSGDGGRTWRRVKSGTRVHLTRLAFSSAAAGIAVGLSGTVVRSDDRGATWQVGSDLGRQLWHAVGAERDVMAIARDGTILWYRGD